ncbi:MAG: HNH endonuclease [Bacteriovoracia bacterium]
MTDTEIERRLKAAIHDERKLSCEILELINLAEDKRIHLHRGYSSLFDWLTKAFHYSEAAAQRRIQSARSLRKTPVIAEKIESGALNITNLAKAESFFRQEHSSVEQRLEILTHLEGKSTREAEQVLAKKFPQIQLQQEKIIPLNEESSRLITVISNQTLGDLAKIRDDLSHKFPNATLAEIITHLAAEAAAKCEKESCSYQDPATGKICGTRYQSQKDHIQPKALGGSNEPGNLRPLCRQHNLLRAEKTYGREFMDQWRRPN